MPRDLEGEGVPPSPAAGRVELPRPAREERSARLQMVEALEKQRGRRLIAYITDPRGGALGTVIGEDVPALLYEHLRVIGRQEGLDLFLATGGGHTMAANNIIHLLREFCEDLAVLVPHRAMSAGTLIALGANSIVMGPLGRLGPVDPTVSNDFNPRKETARAEPGKRQADEAIGISVEDVAGFLALAKDRAGLDAAGMTAALQLLAEKVHPLALGNVHRQSLLIRSVSRRLLELHLDTATDDEKIGRIVDVLTEKLYYHGYQISRHEAERVIGLPVERPSEEAEVAMWTLYAAYRRALHLDSLELNGPFFLDSGIIESRDRTDVFTFVGQATRAGDELEVKVQSKEWHRVS